MNAVIFDMDGVLLDSEQLWVDCWEKLGEQYGLEGISPCLHASIGTTAEKTREIFMEASGNDFPYEINRTFNIFPVRTPVHKF